MKQRTWLREPFSGISHAVGAGLSLAGLVALLVLAQGRPWQTVAFALYGLSLVVLYTASTIYHSLWATPKGEARLQRFDHIAIYCLIAGSYIPLCLIPLRGALGWTLLGIELGLAALGIGIVLSWKSAPDWVRMVIYLVMGWLIVAAFGPLRHVLPPAAMTWMVSGGVVYSIGAIVFATNRPHLWPGKFSAHDLWHLFVLGGSACHFMVMLHLTNWNA